MRALPHALAYVMGVAILHVKVHAVGNALDHVMKAVMDHVLVNALVDVLLGVMIHARARVLQLVREVLNNGFVWKYVYQWLLWLQRKLLGIM